MKKRVSGIPIVARRILIALSFVSLPAAILPTSAVDTSAAKPNIVQLLEDLKLRPFLGKDNPLCQAFYEDFRQQKNITYIKPIIRTDDYDDPELKPYKEKCPDLELNKYMTFEARSFEEVMKLPRDERATYASSISYGTRNFKLYQVDINNNPADGEEYVYYDEAHRFARPADLEGKVLLPHAGHYTVVDIAECQTTGGVDVGNVYGEVADVTTNVHGIIRYRGKHYVYSSEATSDHGRVELHGYARTPQGTERMGSLCTYHN